MLPGMRYALALLGPALLLLAACGGDDNGNTGTVPAELADVCTQGAVPSGAITVTSPKFNGRSSSPLIVTGSVTPVDSLYFFAIVAADGTHITDYPGHATASGTVIPFQQDLPFGVEKETPACLWVSTVNTEDPADAIRIPITLLPSSTPGGS
jgi:hypothetical protein